jgi:hypothetical protein
MLIRGRQCWTASSRTSLKQRRTAASSATVPSSGAMVISPTTSRCGADRALARNPPRLSGARPDLAVSPLALTWMKTGRRRPAAAAARSRRSMCPGSHRLCRLATSGAYPASCRPWTRPMAWNRSPDWRSASIVARCSSRFSPKSRTPCRRRMGRTEGSWFLVTTIGRTPSTGRPARRQASVMRARMRARLRGIVAAGSFISRFRQGERLPPPRPLPPRRRRRA